MIGNDLFPHFTWTVFAVMAAAYTFFVLTCYGFRTGMAFSERNAIPRSKILVTHLNFLAALLAIVWLSSFIWPHLPDWVTAKWIPDRRNRSSVAEVVFIGTLMGMGYLEHRLIYREAEPEGEPQ